MVGAAAGHNGGMSWFKRSDPAHFEGLTEALGRRADVLALATGPETVLAATRESFAVRYEGAWRVWGWEEIAGGSWKSDPGTFRWRTVRGDELAAELSEPGRVPEVFRERVEASTVVQGYVDVPGGQVQIVGRRGLGPELNVHWYAVPARGVDLSDQATRDIVVRETDRLKAEYF